MRVSIPITAMLVITIASCVLTYQAETKRRVMYRINVELIEQLIVGDAILLLCAETCRLKPCGKFQKL